MQLSNFSETGLDIGKDHGMTYLYGISDFFHIMFEDKDVVDLYLEAAASQASEMYSNFLQITTGLSIAQVQETVGVTTKLILINSQSALSSSMNEFSLEIPVQSAKALCNRPFLPTEHLEQGADFEIEQIDISSSILRLAKPIQEYRFSSRPLPDGTIQYAVWVTDAVIDEQLVYKAFGQLIGVAPEKASTSYANYVYGLYYLYTKGPTLQDLRRGLNLILGVPLARSQETILDIRFYADVNQYVVVTDQNQYLIPYGLAPTVAVGDSLYVGEELAQWVEIKDYESDGEWWVNLRIPEHIIPSAPAGQPNRYAFAGSHFEYVMRTYLKSHTFLVKVKVDSFKNVQQFTQISDIIFKAKPSYAQPIYVWTLASQEELIDIRDDALRTKLSFAGCDHPFPDFSLMKRDNPEHDPAKSETRGCATFLRWMGTPRDALLSGNSSVLSNVAGSIDGNPVRGFANPFGNIGANSSYDAGFCRAIMSRDSDTWSLSRGDVNFSRNTMPVSQEHGVGVDYFKTLLSEVSSAKKLVPLYITSYGDISAKCTFLGYDSPLPSEWVVQLLGPDSVSYAINQIGINRGSVSGAGQAKALYSRLFFKDVSKGAAGPHYSDLALNWSWAPTPSDILDDDYLIAVRTIDDSFAVYWVTSNLGVTTPHFITSTSGETLSMTLTQSPARGMALNGQTPYYFLRGWGGSIEADSGQAINEMYINQRIPSVSVNTLYSDRLNSAVAINRQSDISLRPKLTHRITV